MGLLVRVVLALAIAAGTAGGAVWMNYDWVRFRFIIWTIEPAGPFDPAKAPPAYDYSADTSWLALPGRAGKPDPSYPPVADPAEDRGVDVFFVNGTTYLGSDNWNQPPADAGANKMLNERLVPSAWSMLGLCCNVFIPRFRQATFSAFAIDGADSEKAKDLAYGDIERAFDHFIAKENHGRPFIVAGYSQGAYHVFRLLQNRISGRDLRQRMVAAYPMGFWITESELKGMAPDVPVCRAPTQTGCVVGFNAVAPDVTFIDSRMARPGIICVNPLTWLTDEKPAAPALNLGSLSPLTHKTVEGIAGATCVNGQLVVPEIKSEIYSDMPPVLGKGNYHIIGMPLFFGNIRQNMKARADAFLETTRSP